jgi:hypothetical protein
MLNGKEIQLGVKYVTRSGEIVMFTEYFAGRTYPWRSGDVYDSDGAYTDSGTVLSDHEPDDQDLVGEYDDIHEAPSKVQIEAVPCEFNAVTKPKHYQLFPELNIEVKDVVALLCNRLGTNGYNGAFIADFAQMLQYVMRFDEKNGLEDVQKAKYFIDRLVEEYPDVQTLKGKK